MDKSILSMAILAQLACACGAAIPEPTQRLADAQSAERSARELGAEQQPAARLSLELAQNQITQAQKAIADGDNERAESLLIRAKADAELAIARARENAARVDVQKAKDDSAAQKALNAGQGAVK